MVSSSSRVGSGGGGQHTEASEQTDHTTCSSDLFVLTSSLLQSFGLFVAASVRWEGADGLSPPLDAARQGGGWNTVRTLNARHPAQTPFKELPPINSNAESEGVYPCA